MTTPPPFQAILSGQIEAIGGNQFYGDRLSAAGGKDYEVKFDLVTLYNSAATRPGEKDWNEALNAYLDKIKANGDLAKVYAKWMKRRCRSFRPRFPTFPTPSTKTDAKHEGKFHAAIRRSGSADRP